MSYRLGWGLNHNSIEYLFTLDGIFPLITNTNIETSEVLRTYKNNHIRKVTKFKNAIRGR